LDFFFREKTGIEVLPIWIKFNFILVTKAFHIQFLVLYLHRQEVVTNSQKKLNFMKKLIVLALFSFTYLGVIKAQIELKINPIGILIFNTADIVGEYLINENIGLELGIGLIYGNYGGIVDRDFDRSGYRLLVAGKYYFSPDDGCDKFYAGLYLRPKSVTFTNNDDNVDFGFKQSSLGVGLMSGYKWVGARGITIEFGGGLGRGVRKRTTLNDNSKTLDLPSLKLNVFLRLSVGYRFRGDS
jgi:hypothetical protein